MVVLFTGKRGSGKTTEAKRLYDKFDNTFIVDLYNEHEGEIIRDLTKVPNKGKKRIREEATDTKKLFKALEKLNNNFILIEDATIIFNSLVNDESLKRLIIASRHKNNTIGFIFHSIQRVPLFIWEQSNYLYLFKTNETNNTFQRLGNDEIHKKYLDIKSSKDPHKFKILVL
jgi:tRNA uridine 5-carbamoylmethylation protein Kti12